MTTLGSAYRLQRLYRLQTLTIPRQRGSLIVSGNTKTLIRECHFAPYHKRPQEGEGAESFEEQCRLDDKYEALNAEHEQLTTGYSAEDCANAGVIAARERGSLLQIEEALTALYEVWKPTGWNWTASKVSLPSGLCRPTREPLCWPMRWRRRWIQTAPGLKNEVREAVEREALPNMRDVWTPDASFLGRLTKPDLAQILRDVGLKPEASVYSDGKKSKLVDYMDKPFAEPFATLTPSQLEAVTTWAPDLMAHAPIEEEEPESNADEVAITAE